MNAWDSPEIIGDGDILDTGYVQPTADHDSTHEAEIGDETRATDAPGRPGKPRRKRGRIAKDPLNQTFLFECRDADDLETSLRDFLKDSTSPPEHTTVEFRFSASAAFMVYPSGHSQAIKDPLQRIFSKKAVSVIEALQPTYNPKDQIEKQRSIAKICVETVAKADGFKYGFNNNWISKEDGASRFSYFCNDSSLNKARAGNPAASNRVAHKKAQKPVYECEGTIAVKFYNTKQMLEVVYKHIPCHESYAARAPIPRKGTRRRLLMEVFEPDKLPILKPTAGQGGRLKYERRKAKLSLEQADIQSGVDGSDFAPTDQPGDGLQPSVESTSNERILFPAEKLQDLQNAPAKSRSMPKKRKHTGSNIPGTMSGFLDGDEIRMGEERPGKRQATAKQSRKSKRGQSEHDAINLDDGGFLAPASAEPNTTKGQTGLAGNIAATTVPSENPSELEVLKLKLAQAEQQIQRLEAAKGLAAPLPPQAYYYAPSGYHLQPPPQYQYPPQQNWQQYPGYGQPLQQDFVHQNAGHVAHLQFNHKAQAGFGVPEPPRPIPSSSGGATQLLAGIDEAISGAFGETSTSSAEMTATPQTLDAETAATKPPTTQEDVTTSVGKDARSSPTRRSLQTSVATSSADSGLATGTSTPNIIGDRNPIGMKPGVAKVPKAAKRAR